MACRRYFSPCNNIPAPGGGRTILRDRWMLRRRTGYAPGSGDPLRRGWFCACCTATFPVLSAERARYPFLRNGRKPAVRFSCMLRSAAFPTEADRTSLCLTTGKRYQIEEELLRLFR